MSQALDPLSHLTQTVTPSHTPSPLERDELYGQPPTEMMKGKIPYKQSFTLYRYLPIIAFVLDFISLLHIVSIWTRRHDFQ